MATRRASTVEDRENIEATILELVSKHSMTGVDILKKIAPWKHDMSEETVKRLLTGMTKDGRLDKIDKFTFALATKPAAPIKTPCPLDETISVKWIRMMLLDEIQPLYDSIEKLHTKIDKLF